MNTRNTHQKPASPIPLQKPGAGLPFIEALVVKLVYGKIISRRSKPEDNIQRLQLFTDKILKVGKKLNTQQLETPVLVPKLQGLEDSSRFWSVAMTLEHLLIVAKNMKFIIVELSHNRVPPLKVDIAKVKPLGETPSEEVLKEFEVFFKTLPSELKSQIGDIQSRTTLYHPWFGESRALQWHWLLGAHQGIHYNQIKHILRALDLKSNIN